jgi:hypothetical protein
MHRESLLVKVGTTGAEPSTPKLWRLRKPEQKPSAQLYIAHSSHVTHRAKLVHAHKQSSLLESQKL